jgi:Protein of unknown function (DUF3551)
MRLLVLLTGILFAAIALSIGAQAQNYPWCADYGGKMGGSSNCGFSTYEQCMAALSGNGGFCNRNTQYVPDPGGSPGPRYRKLRHHPTG